MQETALLEKSTGVELDPVGSETANVMLSF